MTTLIEKLTSETKGLSNQHPEWVRRGAEFHEVEDDQLSRILSVVVGSCTYHEATLRGAKKMWSLALSEIYGHRLTFGFDREVKPEEIDRAVKGVLKLLDYGDIFVAQPVEAVFNTVAPETGFAGLRWYDPGMSERHELRGLAAKRAANSHVLRPDSRRLIRLAYDEVSGEELSKIQKSDYLKADNRAHTELRRNTRALQTALEQHRHKNAGTVVREILNRTFADDGIRRPPDAFYHMTKALMRVEHSLRHTFRASVPVHMEMVKEAELLREEAVLWCQDLRNHVLAKTDNGVV